ncbi:VOC family protein [Streptomyces tibetensis]|uniref:VOC family protein n=1 Tax=Streptomyces tibetensis TaxID=2382123 RepID=UPI0033F12D02
MSAVTNAPDSVERTAERHWSISAFHNMIPAPRPAQQAPAPEPKESAVEPKESAPGPKEPAVDEPTAARPGLRHLAIVARDPEKLAEFYCSVFAMWFDLSERGFGGPRPPSDSTGS